MIYQEGEFIYILEDEGYKSNSVLLLSSIKAICYITSFCELHVHTEFHKFVFSFEKPQYENAIKIWKRFKEERLKLQQPALENLQVAIDETLETL